MLLKCNRLFLYNLILILQLSKSIREIKKNYASLSYKFGILTLRRFTYCYNFSHFIYLQYNCFVCKAKKKSLLLNCITSSFPHDSTTKKKCSIFLPSTFCYHIFDSSLMQCSVSSEFARRTLCCI